MLRDSEPTTPLNKSSEDSEFCLLEVPTSGGMCSLAEGPEMRPGLDRAYNLNREYAVELTQAGAQASY